MSLSLRKNITRKGCQVEKLHILHTEASCGWDGQAIHIIMEAEEMIKKGHKVTIMCPGISPLFVRAQKKNINVVSAPITKKRWKGVRAIQHWLKHNNVDVICTHSSQDSWQVALAQFLSFRKRVPVVRNRHISEPVSQGRLSKWLYTQASQHIITSGEKMRYMLVHDNKYPEDQITSIPTGMDGNYFKPSKQKKSLRASLGLPQQKKIIGIVAMLRRSKGHLNLLEAFSKMNHEKTHLLIVGNGAMKEAIREKIQSLKLESHVTMTGHVEQPLPYFQCLDVFVLTPTCNEGFSQVITQAMLCEVPVVSAASGAIPESVIHQKTGLLVNPTDPDEIRDACQTILDNDILAKKLGKAGREHILNINSLPHMVDKVEKIYKKVAQSLY